MRGALALALLLVGGTLQAESVAVSLRPESRAVPRTAALRPEGRPLAGSVATAPLTLELRADGEPLADAAMPALVPAGLPAPVARPSRDFLPMLARRPPLLAPEGAAPAPLTGPRAVVRAEEEMASPYFPLQVGDWTGTEPRARPAPVAVASAADGAATRPQARPSGAGVTPPPPAEPEAAAPYAPSGRHGFVPGPDATPQAVAEARLPLPRPAGLIHRLETARAEAARGQVCGNPALQGSAEASFGTATGCGIQNPVRLRSVDGVRLSSPALMDCQTAEALLTWVHRSAKPALAGRGGGLARLDVMGDYACRPRNNQAGQRLSEHGHGYAIDVGGMTMADGSQITVLRDWPGDGLRALHDAACGPFTTVLGPEANAFHRNHFHFDTARGRGPYCR